MNSIQCPKCSPAWRHDGIYILYTVRFCKCLLYIHLINLTFSPHYVIERHMKLLFRRHKSYMHTAYSVITLYLIICPLSLSIEGYLDPGAYWDFSETGAQNTRISHCSITLTTPHHVRSTTCSFFYRPNWCWPLKT